MAGKRLGTRKEAEAAKQSASRLLSTTSIGIVVALIASSIGVYLYKSFSSSKESPIPVVTVPSSSKVDQRWNVSCVSSEYKGPRGCTPSHCARIISDTVIPDGFVKILSGLAQKIMKITPGGAGGPTIWDFHKGALSFNDRFVDIFSYAESESIKLPLTMGDIDALETAVSLVKAEIVNRFDLDEQKLFLTSPSFFARIGGGVKAKTINDEYWHPHVDMVAYGSFTYTALIYLSDYDEDFKGGEFVFRAGREKIVVQPRRGRLSMFTSGSENVHNVEKVTAGKRLALTIAFTCDPTKGIPDFLARAKQYVAAHQS